MVVSGENQRHKWAVIGDTNGVVSVGCLTCRARYQFKHSEHCEFLWKDATSPGHVWDDPKASIADDIRAINEFFEANAGPAPCFPPTESRADGADIPKPDKAETFGTIEAGILDKDREPSDWQLKAPENQRVKITFPPETGASCKIQPTTPPDAPESPPERSGEKNGPEAAPDYEAAITCWHESVRMFRGKDEHGEPLAECLDCEAKIPANKLGPLKRAEFLPDETISTATITTANGASSEPPTIDRLGRYWFRWGNPLRTPYLVLVDKDGDKKRFPSGFRAVDSRAQMALEGRGDGTEQWYGPISLPPGWESEVGHNRRKAVEQLIAWPGGKESGGKIG